MYGALRDDVPMNGSMKRAGGWGGPQENNVSSDVLSAPAIFDHQTPAEFADTRFVLIEKASAMSVAAPYAGVIPAEGRLMMYVVKEGDTLSHIAKNFGISIDTILNANQSLKTTVIKPGQELVLLPVVGILYEVKNTDTVDSIASLYGISPLAILEANQGKKIVPGASITIPGVKPPERFVYASASSGSGLPSYPGYYALPAQGWNWGTLHAQNAVDIANACGTPIFASAEGLVLEVRSSGWNGGYGSYVLLEHPNGTKTRYAHISRSAVAAGAYVNQGDTIAYIGNTGNTHGPTGCHLHFEIIGARNPFTR